MNHTAQILPGAAAALAVAVSARLIEFILPVHLIGAPVLALFIGMGINWILPSLTRLEPGLVFTSKRILKAAIVLLGTSLSINTILIVGRLSLTVMFFTLVTCFGGGWIIGKMLGLNWKLSNLISTGTGICGGSAIAALAPVIEADHTDIAYALSVTFIFDMLMIILFPLMGASLGLTDIAYGLWTGTAVNDTSSVVAAGYAYSEAAGDFATMVKLVRTLAIIPTVLVFSVIAIHGRRKQRSKKVSIGSLIPWFILFFLCAALLNSLGVIPESLTSGLRSVSRFLMVSALAAIGMKTDIRSLIQSGPRPLVHGFSISVLVVITALTVITFMENI